MDSLLSLRALPLFATFFLWAFGTGALQVARPLFAASFGVPLVLVALIVSSNAVSHLLAAPLTGFAMDRWGRRPLLVLGLVLRGGSTTAEFFADSYLQFLVMEFIGGIGVSMWVTGSHVILADLSIVENRGRAVAARSVSSRLGFVAGPVLGAAIASVLDLRWIFLFNAATKVVILAIVIWLIRETRPEPRPERPSGERATASEISLAVFLTRSFLVIALVSFSVQMMAQGVYQALFPVYLRSKDIFSTADVGTFMTIAGLATLFVSMPNGYLVDLYGRKTTLVPGLGVLALAAGLLAATNDHSTLLVTAIAYGIGEGVCFGAAQAYAMDLAPERRRGSFLGIWSLVSNAGGAAAPLLVGLVAQQFGFLGTFVAVGAGLAVVALVMLAFGPDTRARARLRPETATPLSSH